MTGPKIGLALGAGGAKGLAHIGVLQVLEEAKIPIHLITGSSMGAAIGSIYAAGAQLSMMEKLALELNNSHFIDLVIPKWGLVKGKKAHALLRLMTHNYNFGELKIPVGVVATDLVCGERIVFKEGNVANAVRASIAVPGVVEPYQWDGRILVDGAVCDRVPAQLAQEMGADIVISVDLQFYNREKVEITSIFDVIMQSIELLERQVSNYYTSYTDIIVKPRVSDYNWTDFNAAGHFIEMGRMACREVLDEINQKIAIFKDKEQWKSARVDY
ncbi:MAG: patatin-like phospholipase family protein [Peptococcales bacterium]|jgi:NTE family protein